MRRISISCFIILLIKLQLIAQNDASTNKAIEIMKTEEELYFDGIPDEDMWKGLESFVFTVQTPVYGKEGEKSDVRMCFDNDFLYICSSFYYSNPMNITSRGKERDYASDKSDWIGIMLDTFNDKENSMTFFTNPEGLRTDANTMNDVANGFADVNFSWNTFWDVKTSRFEKGWHSEFRIPLSSLRFQEENGEVRMGLILWRLIAKKNEMQVSPAIPPNWPLSFWKTSMAQEIVFKGMKSSKPVYITPYLLAGYNMTNVPNSDNTDYTANKDPKLEAGIDMKIGITNYLTMDLTANTDFAQVEADMLMLNLSRFSVFYPEKRPFFQEKNDVFDFDLLGGNKLFYSRRIGLYDGEAVRIYGGARLTGKMKAWDIGILNMQTAPLRYNGTDSTMLSSENFAVARAKRKILNENSYAGAMLTSRLGMDGSYNIAYGLDSRLRLVGDEYLTVRWAQSYKTSAGNNPFSRKPSRLLAYWERRNQEGFSYQAGFTYSGEEFEPGIGFEVYENYWGAWAAPAYGWFPGEASKIRYQSLTTTFFSMYNTVTGDHEMSLVNMEWSLEWKSGYTASTTFSWNQQPLIDSISFGEITIPPGTYNYPETSFGMNTPGGKNLGLYPKLTAGRFYDGFRISPMVQFQLNIGAGFVFSTTYLLDWVNIPARDQEMINHILRGRIKYMANTKLSVSSYLQYNTAIKSIVSNFRLRYNPKEGSDLYIVYNEGMNTDLMRETPYLPRSDNRTVLVKYTYTFGF